MSSAARYEHHGPYYGGKQATILCSSGRLPRRVLDCIFLRRCKRCIPRTNNPRRVWYGTVPSARASRSQISQNRSTWAGGGVLQRNGMIIRLRARTKGAGRRAGAVFGRPTFSRRTADARGAATPFAREQHAGLLGGRSGDFDAPRLVVDVCLAVDAAGAVRVRSRGE